MYCNHFHRLQYRAGGIERKRNLPASLRVIGDHAFQDSSLGKGIDSVYMPEGLEAIGEGAFENCKFWRVMFEGEVNPIIGKRAFADNPDMWAVYVPNGDCMIAEDAFAGCGRSRHR